MYHIDILTETKAASSVDSIGKFSSNNTCMRFDAYKLFIPLLCVMKDHLNNGWDGVAPL